MTGFSMKQLLTSLIFLLLSTFSAYCGDTSSRLVAAEDANLILRNGKVVDVETGLFSSAVAVRDGKILFVGSDESSKSFEGPDTKVINLNGRTVIPGLNDSHLHVIRGGLNYNLELRWDGVRSLKQALAMLKEQAKRTPEGQWIRVVGGWNEYQFEERRLPTLKEIDDAVPDKPVFILYLYSLGFLNKKGIEVLGYNAETHYPGGQLVQDEQGDLTGLLVAKPSALLLYKTLSQMPMLSQEQQVNSTLHYYRELNRLGVTSAIDAGGGGQFYPTHYSVAEALAKHGRLSVRTSFYLFAQEKGKEHGFFNKMVHSVKVPFNSDLFRVNGYMSCGGGENLVWAAADFENFLEPRPELSDHMESELESVVTTLAKHNWAFRIHATYDESISRFLDVFEKVNKVHPFFGRVRWIVDHAETISEQNLRRIKEYGGAIAVQNRMFFQGEHFIERYGSEAAARTPPVRRMLELGIPVGLGTDGTRVSSYNLMLSLYWLISGRTVGGTEYLADENKLSRLEALRLATLGSAWFSGEELLKGNIKPGMFADMAVLSNDYFSIPEKDIAEITSVLTIVAGKPVYAAQEFEELSPEFPEVIPSWSPVRYFGGYWSRR